MDPDIGPVDLLDQAAAVAADMVDRVGPDRWHAATPCEELDAGAVVEHIVAGLEQFAAVARGEPDDLTHQRQLEAATAGDEYRAAGQAMHDAWSAPGALDATYGMPWGEVPGAVLVEFMFIEELAHAWDLARAVEHPLVVDEDLAEAALKRARLYDDETIRVPGMFGPAQEAPAGAPAIDRLAAFLGRNL